MGREDPGGAQQKIKRASNGSWDELKTRARCCVVRRSEILGSQSPSSPGRPSQSSTQACTYPVYGGLGGVVAGHDPRSLSLLRAKVVQGLFKVVQGCSRLFKKVAALEHRPPARGIQTRGLVHLPGPCHPLELQGRKFFEEAWSVESPDTQRLFRMCE